jgi:hypothetical protein
VKHAYSRGPRRIKSNDRRTCSSNSRTESCSTTIASNARRNSSSHTRIIVFSIRASYPTCLARAPIFRTSCRIQNASVSAKCLPSSYARKSCALYPLASFLYRASLMMAMNRITNSDRSRRMSRNGALILRGSANSAEHRAPATSGSPKSAARQILIHGSAIKCSRITLQISHLQISNRRQTAPFSRAPRAQKRESNESQPAR